MDTRLIGSLERHAASRGVLELASPARGVFYARCQGDLTVDLGRLLAARLAREAADCAGVASFCDWEALDAYETASRVVLTDTAKAVRSRLGKVSILVRSRVVAIGIDVANVVLGNIASYRDRPSWERELTSAIHAAGRSR